MPRTAEKINPKAIRALKSKAAKYDTRDGTVPGLMVVTTPTDRKVWMLEYQRNGKRTRISLQLLADAPDWTITQVKKAQAKAWKQALELRDKLTDKSFDNTTVNDEAAGELRASDTLRLSGEYTRRLTRRFDATIEAGLHSVDNADPDYTYDRNWFAVFLSYD